MVGVAVAGRRVLVAVVGPPAPVLAVEGDDALVPDDVGQADPPGQVNEAFKQVTAAQQGAQSDINQANAYALQLRQIAQGEATAFDKVYEQYRLAPEVTRRRLYYETMERVLRNVDKTIVETPGVTPYLPLGEVRRSPQGAR